MPCECDVSSIIYHLELMSHVKWRQLHIPSGCYSSDGPMGAIS